MTELKTDLYQTQEIALYPKLGVGLKIIID
jgi:hypothetical protein